MCVYIYISACKYKKNINQYTCPFWQYVYTYIYIRISLLEHDTAHLFQVWAGGNVGK
jgi:hypothetical protein